MFYKLNVPPPRCTHFFTYRTPGTSFSTEVSSTQRFSLMTYFVNFFPEMKSSTHSLPNFYNLTSSYSELHPLRDLILRDLLNIPLDLDISQLTHLNLDLHFEEKSNGTISINWNLYRNSYLPEEDHCNLSFGEYVFFGFI